MHDDTAVSPLRRFAASLGRRVSRLRPDLLRGGYLALAIACWVFTGVMAVVLLVPGLVEEARFFEIPGGFAVFFAPLWLRVTLAAAATVLVMVGVTSALLSAGFAEHGRATTVAREVGIAATALYPAFALSADRSWQPALVALALALVAEAVIHFPVTKPRPLAGATVGLPWLVLLAYQFTRIAGEVSWVWLALFWFAASFAAVSLFYGVARAAESRSRALHFLFRNDLRPLVVVAIVGAAFAILILRLTLGRDAINATDAFLWNPWPKQPMSWVLAGIVSVLIVVTAIRASRRPLARLGERRVTVAIGAIGTVEMPIALVVVITGMVIAAITGTAWASDEWVDAYPALQFFLVLALGLAALLPRFRGTAARAIALVSVVYLAPALFVIAYFDWLPSFVSVATPVQIAIILAGMSLLLFAWNVIVPARRVATSVIVRLAAVPVIAIHAGLLLPAAWSGIGRIVIVVLVLAALFLFMPRVAADPRRHAFDVLRASWLQLLALVVFALALPGPFKDETQATLGVLWLSITVIAALSFDTVKAPSASEPASEPAAAQAR
jgi:hypothetical protein